MNAHLIQTPAFQQLRQLVAELSLISHVAGTSYDGKLARDTSQDIGGGRPPGTDVEPRPRKPRQPRTDGDAASEKAWDLYHDELDAWRACYQRRNPEYFVRRLGACESELGLRALCAEAAETLVAWRRAPIPRGQEPALRDPQWKRFVAESVEDAGELARRFDVSRRYINMIRQQYRTGVLDA